MTSNTTTSSTVTASAPRIAGAGDIDTVADIVADSFLHLEAIRFLVPDPARRRPVTRDWYQLHIAHAIEGAGQVVMTEDASATAVWFDRTVGASEPQDCAKRLAEIAGDDLPQFQELDVQMEANHPTEAHWHLLFLAVRPDRWSQGLGSRLMDYTHTRLDADGVPAYLEATSTQNRRLYRRHGYTDMNPPLITLSDATVLFRMWRTNQHG